MKKVFIIIALVIATVTNAQLIDKGSIVVHAGIGIGIFKHRLTYVDPTLEFPRDTSGSVQYPFQVEYGVNRWLSGGLVFNFHKFLTDSSQDERATMVDVGIIANLHIPWNLEKFDFTANIGYGFSRFKYTLEDFPNYEALASGGVLIVGVNPRLYFSKNQHLGIEFWYRHTSHMLNKGEITDGTNVQKFKLDGPGNSFGLGLFYKI